MSSAIHLAGEADLPVRYEFRNRTFAVPLASRLSLPLLRDTIEQIRELRFQPAEIDWLRAQKTFSEPWLEALPDFRLPEIEIGQVNQHLTARYEGPWAQAIFWESILLATISEMYYSQFGTYYDEGIRRLQEKIDYLSERGTLHFSDYGTRRRYSKDWHHYVIHHIKDEIPELLVGTSNAALAMELGIRPIGTMAHQLFMILTALEMRLYAQRTPDAIAVGISDVLNLWADAYRDDWELMTVLPDTYGTDAFIKRARPEDLEPFNAFRQDSGDAVYWSLQLADYAQLLGKKNTLIVPSDSLDVRKMSVIEDNMPGVRLSMGWGTDLTNSLGYESLSIVVKPSAVFSTGEWLPCVKFSDDPQKVTGSTEATRPYYQMLAKDTTF